MSTNKSVSRFAPGTASVSGAVPGVAGSAANGAASLIEQAAQRAAEAALSETEEILIAAVHGFKLKPNAQSMGAQLLKALGTKVMRTRRGASVGVGKLLNLIIGSHTCIS